MVARPLRLTSVYKRTDMDVGILPLVARITQNCFQLKINASKIGLNGVEQEEENTNTSNKSAERAKLDLSVEPDPADHGYELIVDYRLQVDSIVHLIERDKWKDKEVLLSIELDSCVIGSIELALNVRDTVAAQDLTRSTSFRNFTILIADHRFFVNANQLNGLGGRMFKDWYARECQAEQSAVVQSLNTDELEELLKACCAYSTPLVHRRNFHTLLEIADKDRITGLLRLLESFLIDSETIHPIRKLEYAAEYRMSRLANDVLRSFPSRLSRLDCLFGYLAENGESLMDVHLDVLEMLEIHQEHIVL